MRASANRARVPRPHSDEAGFICSARTGAGRGWVVVYRAAEQGIDNDPENPWAAFCDAHGTFITTSSQRLARQCMQDPTGWCEECREAAP